MGRVPSNDRIYFRTDLEVIHCPIGDHQTHAGALSSLGIASIEMYDMHEKFQRARNRINGLDRRRCRNHPMSTMCG